MAAEASSEAETASRRALNARAPALIEGAGALAFSGYRSSFGSVRSLSTFSVRTSSPHTTYRYRDV